MIQAYWMKTVTKKTLTMQSYRQIFFAQVSLSNKAGGFSAEVGVFRSIRLVYHHSRIQHRVVHLSFNKSLDIIFLYREKLVHEL